MTAQVTITPLAYNSQVAFFPSLSWPLLASNFGTAIPGTGKGNWVQAFFDSATANPSIPRLVVSSGNTFQTGTNAGQLICSYVYFAFSGEMKPFIGSIFLATGLDILGNTLTSSNISDENTDINICQIYGGAN